MVMTLGIPFLPVRFVLVVDLGESRGVLRAWGIRNLRLLEADPLHCSA